MPKYRIKLNTGEILEDEDYNIHDLVTRIHNDHTSDEDDDELIDVDNIISIEEIE